MDRHVLAGFLALLAMTGTALAQPGARMSAGPGTADAPPEAGSQGVLGSRLAGLLDGSRGGPVETALAAADAVLAARGEAAPASLAALVAAQRTNVATARALLEASGASGTEPADAALSLLETATAHQAASLGVVPAEPVPSARHSLPSEALRELLARHGAPPPDDALEEGLARLDATGPAHRAALAGTIDAFLDLEAAGGAEDLAGVLAARLGLAGAANQLRLVVQAPGVPLPCISLPGPPGTFFIELGPTCPPTNCGALGDVALSIDEAGNDSYCNNAGGSNLSGGACAPGNVAALIDLAGNDQYAPVDGTGAPRPCGVNGGGHQGVGFLFDAGGHDAYIAGGSGTNGGGDDRGIGLLVDVGGNDVYTAGGGGTNGGASGGAIPSVLPVVPGWVHLQSLGLLLDGGGQDAYTATHFGTNGGAAVGGRGMLVELGGDDTYVATRNGANGGASRGGWVQPISAAAGAATAGFLLDAAGDDTYSAQSSGTNGGGEDLAAGLLLDVAGKDQYLGGGAGSNGGGHGQSGVGTLVDATGDDVYTAGDGGTNGGGDSNPLVDKGYAVGVLVDAQGDEQYTAGDVGTNGGGFNAAGTLLDGSGTDSYTAGVVAAWGVTGTNGAAEGFGLGLLLDARGLGDTYADVAAAYCVLSCGTDKTMVPKGFGTFAGAQVDLPVP